MLQLWIKYNDYFWGLTKVKFAVYTKTLYSSFYSNYIENFDDYHQNPNQREKAWIWLSLAASLDERLVFIQNHKLFNGNFGIKLKTSAETKIMPSGAGESGRHEESASFCSPGAGSVKSHHSGPRVTTQDLRPAQWTEMCVCVWDSGRAWRYA